MTLLFSFYLANLGGQMGLFLGASIVTLTELGEFVFCMVWITATTALYKSCFETSRVHQIK
jgi:hypothetical protein